MTLRSQVEKVLRRKWDWRRLGSKYWILNTEDFLCILDNEYREWKGKLLPLYLPQKYLYLHYNKKNKKFRLYAEDKITLNIFEAICENLSFSTPMVKSKGIYLTKIIDPDLTAFHRTKKGDIIVEDPRIGKNCVIYNGEKYLIKIGMFGMGILDLSNKGIKDIEQIKGIKDLGILGELDVSNNQIAEIKGLENLKNLHYLNLNNNRITEIKGLENFKITYSDGYNEVDSILNLGNNPIPQGILEKIGDLDEEGNVYSPRSVIEYCYKINIQERDSIEKFKKILNVSNRFRLDMLTDILNMSKKNLNNKLKKWSAEFGFKIEGNYLVIDKETVSDFIDALDKHYKSWEKMEKGKMKKTELERGERIKKDNVIDINNKNKEQE